MRLLRLRPCQPAVTSQKAKRPATIEPTHVGELAALCGAVIRAARNVVTLPLHALRTFRTIVTESNLRGLPNCVASLTRVRMNWPTYKEDAARSAAGAFELKLSLGAWMAFPTDYALTQLRRGFLDRFSSDVWIASTEGHPQKPGIQHLFQWPESFTPMTLTIGATSTRSR